MTRHALLMGMFAALVGCNPAKCGEQLGRYRHIEGGEAVVVFDSCTGVHYVRKKNDKGELRSFKIDIVNDVEKKGGTGSP